MNKEELKRLCKEYYPVFTFDDGLFAALIILTLFVIAALIFGEPPTGARLAKSLPKGIAGWIGTIWIIGGKEYFDFLSRRIRLRKILSDDWDIISAKCDDTNVRKEKSGSYKRYKYSVRVNGTDYGVSAKIFMQIITDEGDIYIIFPKQNGCKNGIVIPQQ